MLLKNISALIGENLDFISNIDIQIKDDKISKNSFQYQVKFKKRYN